MSYTTYHYQTDAALLAIARELLERGVTLLPDAMDAIAEIIDDTISDVQDAFSMRDC